jgi:transposase
MRTKAGAFWRLPRFTTAARAGKRRALAVWVCRRCATGCCGSMPGGRTVSSMAKAPGRAPKLNGAQRQELARIIESGPIPAIHGVVRWRLTDLAQWVWEEYRIRLAKQTLSRQLRAMGFRKLSARPRHHAHNEHAAEAFKKKLPRPAGADRAQQVCGR